VAKNARYRWQGFGKEAVRKPKPKKKRRGAPKITNKQARFLAQLQQRAGERYTGAGMTRSQASWEIERLLNKTPGRMLDREWEDRVGRDA
jgi:hypothetical protein